MFRITKRFFSGLLAGLTITETTSVEFAVGFRCDTPIGGSGYEIIAVDRV